MLEQGESVHLGHHHIADDEVVFISKQHLQCFLAVYGMVKLIAVAQFGDDITGYFWFIIYYEDAELAEGFLSLDT